ncbi:hypothetical protein ACFQU2_04980 [Siccirubricoccus deserti]
MPLETHEATDLSLADARWQARVDLAAAHRLAVMHGFHEGIFNHLTLRVPGTDDRYYQILSAPIGPRSVPRPSWKSAMMAGCWPARARSSNPATPSMRRSTG